MIQVQNADSQSISSQSDMPRSMVRLTRNGAVATLTIDRAEKLNAMSRAFWSDFRSALGDIEQDDSLRAVIITGAGDRAFSVGGDIGSFAELKSLEDRRAFQVNAMSTFTAVERFPLPVIAAVNGLALGGGCELAMACDIVLASTEASFAMPEIRFGLVPGYGVVRSRAILGRQLTKLLIFTGARLSAAEAERHGLVQQLHAPDRLLDEAMEMASQIASASPAALRAGKALVDRDIDADAIDRSIEAVSLLHSSAESQAAVAGFLHAGSKNG